MLKQSCWKMGMDYKVNAVVYILAEAFAPLLGGGGGVVDFVSLKRPPLFFK